MTAYLFSGDGLPQVPPGNEVLRGSTSRQEQVGGSCEGLDGTQVKVQQRRTAGFLCYGEKHAPCCADLSLPLPLHRSQCQEQKSSPGELAPRSWHVEKGEGSTGADQAAETQGHQMPHSLWWLLCHPESTPVLALFFVFSLKPELPTQKQVLRQRKAGPGISSQRTSLERVGPGRPWGPGRAVGENAPKERSRAWELPGAGQAPKPN